MEHKKVKPPALRILSLVLIIDSIAGLLGAMLLYFPLIQFQRQVAEQYTNGIVLGMPLRLFGILFSSLALAAAFSLFKLKKVSIIFFVLLIVIDLFSQYYAGTFNIGILLIMRMITLCVALYYRNSLK